MPTAIEYDFSTPSNYTYDSSKIEISSGIVSLKAPYSTDSPSIKPSSAYENEGFGLFSTFSATTATGSDSLVKFSIEIDDVEKCFNTSSKEWEIKTADNLNTASEINSGLFYLYNTEEVDIKPVAYLISTGGASTPTLSVISYKYRRQSYVPISFIDEYCLEVGYSEWANLTTAQRRAAALRSMHYLESKRYKGYKTEDEQDLEFPRSDIYDKNNLYVNSNEIPLEIKYAEAEGAYIDSQTKNDLQPSLSKDKFLTSKTIGPISKSWSGYMSAKTVHVRLNGFLREFLISHGGGMVIRG